jgi:hypothetical protein
MRNLIEELTLERGNREYSEPKKPKKTITRTLSGKNSKSPQPTEPL